MKEEEDDTGLSPTVLQVIDEFVGALRGDGEIPEDGVNALERLLRQPAVPKPDDINAALFARPEKPG